MSILALERVIINSSVITRVDRDGVEINNVLSFSDVTSIDKFITNRRVIFSKEEDGSFRCVYKDCYFVLGLGLPPVTIVV